MTTFQALHHETRAENKANKSSVALAAPARCVPASTAPASPVPQQRIALCRGCTFRKRRDARLKTFYHLTGKAFFMRYILRRGHRPVMFDIQSQQAQGRSGSPHVAGFSADAPAGENPYSPKPEGPAPMLEFRDIQLAVRQRSQFDNPPSIYSQSGLSSFNAEASFSPAGFPAGAKSRYPGYVNPSLFSASGRHRAGEQYPLPARQC